MPLDETNTNYENHIPAAVRRASARADELARGGPVVVDEPAPVDPPSDPAPAPAAPAVVADPPVVVAQPDPAIDWENRYRTLQGKYDSEVPRLQGQIASLERVIGSMQHQAVPHPETAPSTPGATTTTVVPEEDIATYGEDLILAARRWAKAEVQSDIDNLTRQVQELRGGHAQIQTEGVHQRVFNALDADPALAGKWRTLNSEPDFLTWLNQLDDFSGRPRVELMRNAFDQGDANRTARFFKTYLDEHTASGQPSPAAGVHTPQGADPRPTLEDMAAPGRANLGGAPGGAPAEKRVWTTKEITAFYRDCTGGRYQGREAERLRREQDIFDATREGRIRQ